MRSLRAGGALCWPGVSVEAGHAGRQGLGTVVFLAHVVVLGVLGAGGLYLRGSGGPAEAMLTPLSVVILLVFLWLLVTWKVARGALFNLYGLFLMVSMPFHGGYAVLRVLGMEGQMGLLADFTPETIRATLMLVLFGYAGLHAGALLANLPGRGEAPEPPAAMHGEGQSLYLVGWLLLVVSTGPVLMDIRQAFSVVVEAGYQGLFQQSSAEGSASDTVIGLLAAFYLPGVMFLLAGSRHRPVGQVVSALALAGYALAYLLLGYRAYAMLPVLAFAWLWHHCIRPLPIVALSVTGGGLFLFVAPLVRHIRGMSGVERFNPEMLWAAYTSVENPVTGLIGELGGSMLTISYMLEAVPAMRPVEWGMGYLRALANAIPILDLPDPYGSTSSWLAWTFKPMWAAHGFGFGFSFIGEAFLNFGRVGGPLFLAVVGALLVGAMRWGLRGGDPARWALLASVMPVLLFMVRGEAIDLARPLLWYALTPYLAVLLLRDIRRRLPDHVFPNRPL